MNLSEFPEDGGKEREIIAGFVYSHNTIIVLVPAECILLTDSRRYIRPWGRHDDQYVDLINTGVGVGGELGDAE